MNFNSIFGLKENTFDILPHRGNNTREEGPTFSSGNAAAHTYLNKNGKVSKLCFDWSYDCVDFYLPGEKVITINLNSMDTKALDTPEKSLYSRV